MTFPRSLAASASLALGLLLAAPAADAAAIPPAGASVVTATTGSACTVTGGTLTWGVKESFRSYISGSIAQGGWDAADGATYATPSFTFTGATGELDPVSGAGHVSFAGSVHFTGHGGILDLTIATPTLRIAAGGKATLLMDVRSNDTSGAPAVDAKQAEIGGLVAPLALDAAAGTLAGSAVPVTLTAPGAPAFGGFYQEGEELDPLTADVQLTCAAATPTPTQARSTPAAVSASSAAAADAGGVPWAPVALGAGAVVVVGAVVTILVARRRRS